MKITLIKKKNYKQLKKLYDNFEVVKDGEIYVVVGGDGTFIKAAQRTDKPILLIRDDESGSTGYNSEINLDQIDEVVKDLKKNKFYVDHVSRKIEVVYKDAHYFGINEIRLNNIVEEVSFKVYEVHGFRREPIYPFVMSGDGLLITSAMGSTAYNKSAGGPIILTPNILCITFLNPDGPYRNSIILDSTREIEVEVIKYEGILRNDSTFIATLKKGNKFRVKFSNKKINLLKFKHRREKFADKLERKIRSRLIEDFKD